MFINVFSKEKYIDSKNTPLNMNTGCLDFSVASEESAADMLE